MTQSHPIKVCFETQRAYPLFNSAVDSLFGGTEVDLYFLATELAKDPDFIVSLVLGDYGQPALETRHGVTLIKSVDIKKNFLLGGHRLWRAFRRADADIYLRQGVSLGAALAALFCRKHKRIFVCRTAHSRECDGSYFERNPWRARACRWTLRRAQQVIVQNEIDARNLSRTTGVDAMVIRNGHRLPQTLPADARDTILWVGRSIDFKCPQRFLDLACRFTQEKFTMVCPRAVEDTTYDQLTARAGQIANLDFISAVPFGEIDSYFQRAKVFVNTSDQEGFPNTFIQACKVATPILSLKVNPDNFLHEHRCGLCPDGDERQFDVMLQRLLDPAVAAEYAASARQYAQEYHDITKIVGQYKSLFQELVSRVPRP